MKRLLLLLIVLVLAVFSLGGCLDKSLGCSYVDPDEAMPYYQTP